MIAASHQLKIAIVDDHNLFRKGLIKLINLGDTDNRYTILFEAENGLELKEKLSPKCQPDIVLMDIEMPDMDGFETVGWLKKYYPDISILVVSMFESEEAIVRMVRLGVHGYLSKDIEVEDMHKALEALAAKKIYFSDMVTTALANVVQNGVGADATNKTEVNRSLWDNISENERIFLNYACTELTYAEIADKMKLSPKTIDGYRESLFLRFRVKSRVSLAMFAVKNNLVKI